MTIKCIMTVKAYIYFDGNFKYEALASQSVSLDQLINTAKYYIGEYGFVSATVVDAETGEVLVEMESDCNDLPDDDDGPEYYDDGDTCGYE